MKYNNHNSEEFDKFFGKVMSNPVKYRGAIHEYISTGEIPDLENYKEPDEEEFADTSSLSKAVDKLVFLDEEMYPGLTRDYPEKDGLEKDGNYSIVQMEKRLPERERVIKEAELIDLKILLETSSDVGEFLRKI